MRPQRPATVTASIWLTVAVMAVSGISALLTVPYKDELISAWRAGRPDTSSVEQPAFIPVALVMFVVVAMLTAVLLMFFREGHNWARLLIISTILLLGIATLAVLRTELPTLFLVLCWGAVVLDVAAVGCLMHKDTRTWFRTGVAEPAARS